MIGFSRKVWPKTTKAWRLIFDSMDVDGWKTFVVVAAEMMIEDPPSFWCELRRKKIYVKCAFWDVGGDTLADDVSIDDAIEEWLSDYDSVKVLSKAQEEDMRERCAAIRRLSNQLLRLANRFDPGVGGETNKIAKARKRA